MALCHFSIASPGCSGPQRTTGDHSMARTLVVTRLSRLGQNRSSTSLTTSEEPFE